jgi:hypothetical protein
LPWPVTGVRIARIESMNGVLGRIILIAMVLDGGTRQSATPNWEGQILHEEDLQRKIMGQDQTCDLL